MHDLLKGDGSELLLSEPSHDLCGPILMGAPYRLFGLVPRVHGNY